MTRVETPRSWLIAAIALLVLTIAYGAPLATVVALKPIAEEFGTTRSAPALAVSLTYVGAGFGAIVMGWLSGRFGARIVTMLCAVMIGVGLTTASQGGLWHLYLSNLLLIGLLGSSGMFSPLMAYVSRWFDRHRGQGVALISSGPYVAGAVWPLALQYGVAQWGWRRTMMAYAILVVGAVVPLAAVFFRAPPEAEALTSQAAQAKRGVIAGIPPNAVQAMLGVAIFCCCMTMSIPLTHMVAFCGDIGIGPGRGAAMLSVQLGAGFLAQQLWGWVADRLGGIRTVLCASVSVLLAMGGFLLTNSELWLFAISAAFGLGFGGLIPGYVLAIRDLFPAEQASWRIPLVMFPGALGMAGGGWVAGLLYDQFGGYTPAFLVGIAFNLANLVVVAPLVLRQRNILPRGLPA